MNRGKTALLALMLWSAAGFAVAAQGENAPGEYQVKAAILYNFAKFVEWPADAFPLPSAPLVIGILGNDPFGSAFDTAKGKLIKGRKVRVIRSGDVQDLTLCHVLFISSSERGRLFSVLKEFQGGETIYRVRDNGRGINAENMPQLFQLFRRLGTQDMPGEGVGLSYVKALVRKHGGRIWCESKLGEGSVFSFTVLQRRAADR